MNLTYYLKEQDKLDTAIEFWIKQLEFNGWTKPTLLYETWRTEHMNIFDAYEVFFALLEAKPCHVH